MDTLEVRVAASPVTPPPAYESVIALFRQELTNPRWAAGYLFIRQAGQIAVLWLWEHDGRRWQQYHHGQIYKQLAFRPIYLELQDISDISTESFAEKWDITARNPDLTIIAARFPIPA